MPKRVYRKRTATRKRPTKRRTTKKRAPIRKRARRVNNPVTISGHGDYYLKKNSLLSGAVPAFGQNQKPVRIIHKEYVCPVKCNANGSFRNEAFYVNPGNVSLFPWLSQQALMYDSYDINGMILMFKSFTSEQFISTQNFSGGVSEIIMVSDYNVSDPPHSNKVSALNTEFAVSGKTSRDLIHAVECANGKSVFGGKRFITEKTLPNQFYNTNNSIAPQDPVKYFFNQVNIITQGAPPTSGAPDWDAGELWVSYDITLYKAAPQVNNLPQGLWAELAGTVNVPIVDTTAGAVNVNPETAGVSYSILGADCTQVAGNLQITTYGTDPGYHTGLAAQTTGPAAGSQVVRLPQAAGLVSQVITAGYTKAVAEPRLTITYDTNQPIISASTTPIELVRGQQLVFPSWLTCGTFRIDIYYQVSGATQLRLDNSAVNDAMRTCMCSWNPTGNPSYAVASKFVLNNAGAQYVWRLAQCPNTTLYTDPYDPVNWRNCRLAYGPTTNEVSQAIGLVGDRTPYQLSRTNLNMACLGHGLQLPDTATTSRSIKMDPVYLQITGPDAKWTLPQMLFQLVGTAATTAYCTVRIQEINESFL